MSIPSFTDPVADNGYRWWYLDAVSDDDQHALTLIVFIGSVFSPYYARARKHGVTQAADYCAVNVALYGTPWRWCMTERTSNSMQATSTSLSIGKSCITVEANRIVVSIDEIAVPLPSRVRGQLTIDLPDYILDPVALNDTSDGEAPHFWQPIAPQTRIDVSFDKPSLKWQGNAYVDSNYGDAPLESSFKSWVWSRSHTPENATNVLYDVVDRQGNGSQRGFQYSADGTVSPFDAPQNHTLPSTRYWRIPRAARTVSGSKIRDVQTLEDTPFYSRSRFNEEHDGKRSSTVHESLYLENYCRLIN